MITNIKLTDTQRAILEHAADQPEGRITWFPSNVNGGARQKVLDGLCNKALITRNRTNWFVAAEGYDAIGHARPTPVGVNPNPKTKAAVAAAKGNKRQEKKGAAKPLPAASAETKPRTRENSKQAEIITMLKRPVGATIGEICTATGWQPHTVRGTFAGAFKKKGLAITSTKESGRDRVYFLPTQKG